MCGSVCLLFREGKRHEVAENERASFLEKLKSRASLQGCAGGGNYDCSDSSSAGCGLFSTGPSLQGSQGKAHVETYPVAQVHLEEREAKA